MKVTWNVPHEMEFDMEQAISDFNYIYRNSQDADYAIYEAVETGIRLTRQYEVPNEVVERLANSLRMAIGGIQTEMELD